MTYIVFIIQQASFEIVDSQALLRQLDDYGIDGLDFV